MHREEVIAKALKDHRERLSGELSKNRVRQKELVELIEEHQLAMKTLYTLVGGRPRTTETRPMPPERAEVETSLQPTIVARSLEQSTQAENTVTVSITMEKKVSNREKLKIAAFPFIQSRFPEEPFEVSKIRDLLDEIEPGVAHTYEAAWNLCNDLLREGKLKQAGIRNLPKGVVRLFKLRTTTVGNQAASGNRSSLVGG